MLSLHLLDSFIKTQKVQILKLSLQRNTTEHKNYLVLKSPEGMR